VVRKIPTIEGDLFAYGLICYFYPGSQKISILTAQNKGISKEQGVATNNANSISPVNLHKFTNNNLLRKKPSMRESANQIQLRVLWFRV
jgi:hypothetical protein